MDVEIVVVGAGPAGSSAAYHLASRNRRVMLVERQAFPRDKSCGDALTRAAMTELFRMGITEFQLRGRRASGVRVSMRGRGQRVFDYPDDLGPPTNGFVVPRLELDHVLCRRAVEAGAELWERSVASALLIEGNSVYGVEVGRDGQNHMVRARAVIAADGATSRLARQAGLLSNPEERMGFAIRGYIEGISGLEDRLEILMPLLDPTDRYLLPSYGWIFPVGLDRANVGVGLFERDHGANVRELFERFVEGLRREDPRFEAAALVGRRLGAPLRFDFAPERSALPGLVLVGDAAGMISPFTGEGISFALESGRIAAEIIDAELAKEGSESRVSLRPALDVSEYSTRLAERYTGYFETGRHAARRYRVVWHVLESTFQSERPIFSLARQAVLFPEGVGESFVEAAFDDVSSFVGDLQLQARRDLTSVGQVLVDTVRRDWPFLARAASFERSGKHLPFRPALMLFLCSYLGTPNPVQTTLVAAALELGYLGGLAQMSVEEDTMSSTAEGSAHLGEGSANWGNMFAVMVADFLFAKAYAMSASVGSWLSRLVAGAVAAAAEARVRELRSAGNVSIREAGHLRILEQKTSVLFGLPCRLGARLGDMPEASSQSLGSYGRALGVSFELTQEVLDIRGTTRRLGATSRTGLELGLYGLPVIHALGHPQIGPDLRGVLSERPLSSASVEAARELIAGSDACEQTLRTAGRFADEARRALHDLPDHPALRSLSGLVDFVHPRSGLWG